MCGITGLMAIEGPLDPKIANAIGPMTGALAHRGPDGDGFYQNTFAALGHRRLAIIDRERGKQPLSNERGTCWITFNGEVYNHHELRRELAARGHVFRTHSDTETIVHAYEEYGTACVERLEGMFAFAIFDEEKRSLFVARDRLGKKPLFYASFGGVFHFASEIKALRQSPAWQGEVDLRALEGYLSLGYFLAPDTVYRHVKKLEPGHWLHVANGRIETRQYWDVREFDTDTRPPSQVVDDLEAALRHAVHERLESEVPLGAFLSGGIDSGLVVSFMAEAQIPSLVTTSVGFSNQEHNELDAAGLTARRFGSEHYPDIIAPRLSEVLEAVVEGFDEPFADSSAIPTYYVSAMARRHVTVALSGDGGDESFGGYDFRYTPHAYEAWARQFVPGAAGRKILRQLGAAWPRSRALPRALRLGTVLENVGRDAADAYYADLCFMKPELSRQLLGLSGRDPADSPVYEAVTAPYRRCPSKSAIQKAEYADLKVYLPNDVLVKVDRMSMLHSLEVRCPLLDRRIVEFGFRVPTETKLPRFESKHLLRTLAERRLPSELASMPKHGFTAPVGEWLSGEEGEIFRAEVLSPIANVRDLVDQSMVRRMFNEHRRGERDFSYPLWAVWMLERWSVTSRRESALELACPASRS